MSESNETPSKENTRDTVTRKKNGKIKEGGGTCESIFFNCNQHYRAKHAHDYGFQTIMFFKKNA